MKRLIYAVLLFSSTISLVSCFTSVPLKRGKSDNNETYRVQYLFEHDGCKVYRFYDMGNYVYFTNCQGNVTSITNDSTEHQVVNVIHAREGQ